MMGKNNKGFTLIELLVVISIIALLSSIILSAVKDARDKAGVRAFEQDLVQIRNAIQIYREKNNGAWPPSFVSTLIDKSANNTVVLNNLITELYSDGSYSKSTLNYPPLISSAYVKAGQKNANYLGRYWSCDQEPGNEFVIYFFNSNGSSNPITHSSFGNIGYWNGSWIIYDGAGGSGHSTQYFYCLNIK